MIGTDGGSAHARVVHDCVTGPVPDLPPMNVLPDLPHPLRAGV